MDPIRFWVYVAILSVCYLLMFHRLYVELVRVSFFMEDWKTWVVSALWPITIFVALIWAATVALQDWWRERHQDKEYVE